MTSGRLASWYSVQPWSCWSLQARRLLTVTATTSASTALDSGHSAGRLSTKPTRARREHAERLRRRANPEFVALDAIGVEGAYNPKRPWEYVFRQLPVEFAFWKRELEDPALLILARAPVAAITSEAPVAKTRDQHITQVAGDVPLTVWRGKACIRNDGALVSLPRLVSTSLMTRAITSVIVVACSSARLFKRVPVRRHVLNKWPISARFAYTLLMALRTVPKLARQLRSRLVTMRTRVRERNTKGRGKKSQWLLLPTTPARSATLPEQDTSNEVRVPTRSKLTNEQLRSHDVYIGRGSQTRATVLQRFAVYARAHLVHKVHLLAVRRLLCHSETHQHCHGDVLVELFQEIC